MPWNTSILFIEANKVGKNTALANRALSSDFVFFLRKQKFYYWTSEYEICQIFFISNFMQIKILLLELRVKFFTMYDR
jgi:hypothetical protein